AALFPIRVNHVERARERGDAQAPRCSLLGNVLAECGVQHFGECRQSDARHVELHAIEAVRCYGIERLLQRRTCKRLRKDAELHHTPPVTSASRTRSPVSTDLAMATSARIAATPSSMFAPCCGAPWRIVSATPSIWSL